MYTSPRKGEDSEVFEQQIENKAKYANIHLVLPLLSSMLSMYSRQEFDGRSDILARTDSNIAVYRASSPSTASAASLNPGPSIRDPLMTSINNSESVERGGESYSDMRFGFDPCSLRSFSTSAPIWLASLLSGFVYYVFCFILCGRRLILNSETNWSSSMILGTLFLIVFNILFAMFVMSYLRCILTDPGSIPDWFNLEEVGSS
jgi:hypothetical protein